MQMNNIKSQLSDSTESAQDKAASGKLCRSTSLLKGYKRTRKAEVFQGQFANYTQT